MTVEETQIKDKKCILLRIKGGKQFVLQCEVKPIGHFDLFVDKLHKKLILIFLSVE